MVISAAVFTPDSVCVCPIHVKLERLSYICISVNTHIAKYITGTRFLTSFYLLLLHYNWICTGLYCP